MIYLLHFDRPYKHARHYLGWVDGPEALQDRLDKHRNAQGARLMQVIAQAGIGFTLVRVWGSGSRVMERRIKNTRHVPHYCPICRCTRRR